MQVNLTLSSLTIQGKKLTTTISWVNPNVPNNKFVELSRALNTLTTNTYTTTYKETKEEI